MMEVPLFKDSSGALFVPKDGTQITETQFWASLQ